MTEVTAASSSLARVRDSIVENTAMAQTLVYMLHDITGADDNIPDGPGPTIRQAARSACSRASTPLRDRITAISRCGQSIEQEVSHG